VLELACWRRRYVYATVARPPHTRIRLRCVRGWRPRVAVVLLDRPTRFRILPKREIRTVLVEMAETLPAYERLGHKGARSEAARGSRFLQKCNQGDGDGLSEYTAQSAAGAAAVAVGIPSALGRGT